MTPHAPATNPPLDLRCHYCDYSLEGLANPMSAPCPECGLVQRPGVAEARQRWSGRSVAGPVAFFLVTTLALSIGAAFAIGASGPLPPSSIDIALSAGVVFAGLTAAGAVPALGTFVTPGPYRRWHLGAYWRSAWALPIAAVATLLANVVAIEPPLLLSMFILLATSVVATGLWFIWWAAVPGQELRLRPRSVPPLVGLLIAIDMVAWQIFSLELSTILLR